MTGQLQVRHPFNPWALIVSTFARALRSRNLSTYLFGVVTWISRRRVYCTPALLVTQPGAYWSMAILAAFLRAINVGGTGKLAMADLKQLCEEIGFEKVTTYIQSGNVVFSTKLSKTKAQQALADALGEHLGKTAQVHVRTSDELESIVSHNPFPKATPNLVQVILLDRAPSQQAVSAVASPDGEEVVVHGRELFVHYPNGSGRSKLKLPLAKDGTARNMNTIRKMLALCQSSTTLENRG